MTLGTFRSRGKLMTRTVIVAAIAAIALTGCASTYVTRPIIADGQQVRYEQGIPTTLSEKKSGAVEVTPLGVDADKRLVFGVAAYNEGKIPQNFGVENLSLMGTDGKPIGIMTADEIIRSAQRKAEWAEVALAFIGAADAYAAAASARTTTTGHVYGPGGSASFTATTYDPALAYAGAHQAAAETAHNMAQVEGALSRTIASARTQVLQTTTVDPGTSYGGDAVVDGLGGDDFPHDLILTVQWNGDEHVFRFTMTKEE